MKPGREEVKAHLWEERAEQRGRLDGLELGWTI